jgi:hypothetical protein
MSGSPFRNGDLFTGIDRSFTRSIYRFDAWVPGDVVRVTLVSFNGIVCGDGLTMTNLQLQEYRNATLDEIAISLIGEKTQYERKVADSRDFDDHMKQMSRNMLAIMGIDAGHFDPPKPPKTATEVRMESDRHHGAYVDKIALKGTIRLVGDLVDDKLVDKIRQEFQHSIKHVEGFRQPILASISPPSGNPCAEIQLKDDHGPCALAPPKACECGKEKHGFAGHSDWCPMKEENFR